MKPFNLERALAGDKVITRNGNEVIQLHKFKGDYLKYPLVGIIVIEDDYYLKWWLLSGKVHEDIELNKDLFMSYKKKKLYFAVSIKAESCFTNKKSDIYQCHSTTDAFESREHLELFINYNKIPSDAFKIIEIEIEE